MTKLPITNFSRGEFGPELYGRVDVPQYSAGAKRLRNFIVQRYGGAAFRPGFRFVFEFDVEEDHRLVPFQYSMEQAYMLTLGNERMWASAFGGMVVEDDLKILSATLEDGVIVEVPFHDYVVGEIVHIDGITGMEELNNRFATVTEVVDANHVRLDIDSTAFGALTDSTGDTRTEAPAAPPAPEDPLPEPDPVPPPPTTTGGGYVVGDRGYWERPIE